MLIFNSDFEYLKAVNITMHQRVTSPVCHGNSVLSNKAADICVFKQSFNINNIFCLKTNELIKSSLS